MNFSVDFMYVFLKKYEKPVKLYYYPLTEITGRQYHYCIYIVRNFIIYSFPEIKPRLLNGTKMIFPKNDYVYSDYPFIPLKLYKNIKTGSLVCEKSQLNIKNSELSLPKQKSNKNILLESKANRGVPK